MVFVGNLPVIFLTRVLPIEACCLNKCFRRYDTHIDDTSSLYLTGGGTECASMEVDMGVLDYLMDEQAAGRPVSNDDLKEKAREVARGVDDLGNSREVTGGCKDGRKGTM